MTSKPTVKFALTLCCMLLLCIFWGCSSSRESNLDNLWQQGYGFNNPNVERIREGKPPVDFRGNEQTFSNSLKNVGSEIVMQTVGGIIQSGVDRTAQNVKNFFRPF